MQTTTVILLLCIACATSAQGAAARLEDANLKIAGSLALNDKDGSYRRSLLQTYGNAINTNFSSDRTGTGVNVAGYDPTGSDCYISSSKTASLNCKLEGTGSVLQQIPACCSSTSTTSSNKCNSWDNAGYIVCSASSTPYPACCTTRAQPASACTIAPTTTQAIRCNTNINQPIPACCNSRSSGTCTIDPKFIYGASVNCGSAQYDACCPA